MADVEPDHPTSQVDVAFGASRVEQRVIAARLTDAGDPVVT